MFLLVYIHPVAPLWGPADTCGNSASGYINRKAPKLRTPFRRQTLRSCSHAATTYSLHGRQPLDIRSAFVFAKFAVAGVALCRLIPYCNGAAVDANAAAAVGPSVARPCGYTCVILFGVVPIQI